MSELPQSWIRARLAEVCNHITDGTHHSPPNNSNGDFMYITAKNIRPSGIDLSELTYVDSDTHNQIFRRCPVERGDVLYIKDGVTTGLAVVNNISEPFSMLSSVALLKPNRNIIDEYFLKHWLNSPSTYVSMTGQMTGSAIRRLTLTAINGQYVDVPPLAEQRRIVAKLDSLFARTKTARDELARIPLLIEHYKRAILEKAFTGELTEAWREQRGVSSGWPVKRASSLFSWASGKFLPKKNQMAGDIPVFGGNGVNGMHSSAIVHHPTLVIGRVGAQCGNVYRTSGPAWVTDNAIYASRISDEIVLSYAHLVFAKANLNASAGGSGQPFVNQTHLNEIAMSLPEPAEQTEIVRRIEAAWDWLDVVATEQDKAAQLLDHLDRGLLAKAFCGELVPQDPNDEPAEKLLERIRAARRAEPKPRRGRRMKERT